MIPITTSKEEEVNDFELILTENTPSKTYGMDLSISRMTNYADEQAAMRQAIFKILQTERYDHPQMYSANYGVELKNLIGLPTGYVRAEAQRRIVDALTWDERISRVSDFSFEQTKNRLLVTFTAYTIFGNLTIDNWEVMY